jgi:hypothetical protein
MAIPHYLVPSVAFGAQTVYRELMHWPVEVNLRVPSLRIPTAGEPQIVNNQQVRFKRLIVFDAVIRPGEVIPLTAGTQQFEAEVLRVTWSESAGGFVADCRYTKPRILPELYQAILADSAWLQWSLA